MYQRILVAVDDSPCSQRALAAALALARDTHALVRLLHVIDDTPMYSGLDLSGDLTGELTRVLREHGTGVLARAEQAAQAAGIPTQSVLVERFGERLGDAVVAEAAKWNADLIVLGTHGRRGMSRLLLGSGAEQVLRLSPLPVLIVRDPEPAPD
jgi:nucleotide-binding universal stress UspA family protein